jgi:hypothetical protein
MVVLLAKDQREKPPSLAPFLFVEFGGFSLLIWYVAMRTKLSPFVRSNIQTTSHLTFVPL